MRPKRVCLAIVIALCVCGMYGAAAAQDPSLPVEIRVESILATYRLAKTPPGHLPPVRMDKRLGQGGVGQRLRSTFDFTDYRLIRLEQESTTWGDPVAFNLPGGHILHVQPIEIDGDELAMDLVMFEGTHAIMHMPFRTASGGMLFLVDQRDPHQLYITALLANSRMLAHHRQKVTEHSAVNAPLQAFPALVPAQ
jgi:hypothetical protein